MSERRDALAERVAEALALHRQFGFGCTGCDWIGSDLTGRAKDDHRRHQAAAVLDALPELAQAQAAAWDEGYSAAEGMARSWGHTDHWEDEPANPYRAALAGPEPTDPEQEGRA